MFHKMAQPVQFCIEAAKIKSIMETMDYGPVFTDVELGKTWLRKNMKTNVSTEDSIKHTSLKNYVYDESIYIPNLTESVAKAVLSSIQADSNQRVVNNFNRANILFKISSSLHQNADLLGQVNAITKGISAKDIKVKDIPMMRDFFQYYGSWANLIHTDLQDWIPYGNVACILPEEAPLCMLAWALAPSFAAGNGTILCVEGQLTPLAHLFAEICFTAGMPHEYLTIVCSEDRYNFGQMSLLKDPLIDKISYFGGKDGAKTLRYGLGGFPRNISLFVRSKCPMIILSDADLDSACDVIIDAAWSHTGQLPWALNTIFVQENVITAFTAKLKNKMSKLIVGSVQNSLADVSISNDEELCEKLSRLLEKARLLGIEYYQAPVSTNNSGEQLVFTPTVFFGAQVEGNNVLTENNDTPVVTVLTFRTPGEAVALANNTKYGLAAAIWTQNGSLTREISAKLHVGTVWINCYGLYPARASICPYKESGVGYFGGKEGLLSNMKIRNSTQMKYYNEYHSPEIQKSTDRKDSRDKVEIAKKAFALWSKFTSTSKCNALRKLAEEIKKILSICENHSSDWTQQLNINASRCETKQTHSFQEQYCLTTLSEPVGIIVIDTVDILPCIKLITAAIANGNAVILVCPDASFITKIAQLMPSCGFPANVLTVIKSDGYLKSLIEHHEVQAYFFQNSSDEQRNFRARHVEWRSVFNLKNCVVFSTVEEIPTFTVEMMTANRKSIISVFGESLNS